MSKEITIFSTTDSPEEMKAALGGDPGTIAEDKSASELPTPETVPGEGESSPPDEVKEVSETPVETPTSEEPPEEPAPEVEGEGEVEVPETPAEEASGTPQEPLPPQKPKRKSKLQKRIDDLTREKYEAEAKANALEDENKALKEKPAPEPEPTPQAPTPPPEAEPPRPKAGDYGTTEEFLEAISEHNEGRMQRMETRYKAEQEAAIQKLQSDAAQRDQDREVEARRQTRKEVWDKSEATARAKYEDYAEVTKSEIRVSKDVSELILASDHGAELVYYMGSNPVEAARISAIRDRDAVALEIGGLIHTLRAPAAAPAKVPIQPPKKTNAPAPLKPLGTQSAQSTYDYENMDQAEYNRLRDEGKL